MKNLKKVFATFVAVAVMAQLLFVTPVFASNNGFDMSLTTEISQTKSVRNQFLNMRSNAIPSEKIQSESDQYIPEGAKCTDISVIGEVVYIDYQLDNARYLIAYYSDGTVEKVVRALNGYEVYSIDSKTNKIEHTNTQKTLVTQQISEAEASQRLASMVNEAWPENSVYPLDSTLSRAGEKEVDPIKYTAVASTAPYKAKVVEQGNVTISALSGTGYSTSQPYRVYETMSYHAEVKKGTQLFGAATTLTKIAQIMFVPMPTIKVWITAAAIGISAANILLEACRVIETHEYTYLGGKECGIYDPTQNKTYVETYSSWGEGKITMTWSFYSSEYRSPTWGHSSQSLGLKQLNSTVRDEGKNIYNRHITINGIWRAGVGNGFGY